MPRCLLILDLPYYAFLQYDSNSVAVDGVFDRHLADEDRSTTTKAWSLPSRPIPSSYRRQYLRLPAQTPGSRVRCPVKDIR